MKVKVYNLEGKVIDEIETSIFEREEYRKDLIKKAFLVEQSHSFQPKGAYKRAGMRWSVDVSKRRYVWKSAYIGDYAIKVPRKTMLRRGSQFYWVGAQAPNTVKGRRAFPPQVEKKIHLKINKKERKKAILSALNGITKVELVKERHKSVKEAPVVVEDKIEEICKVKDMIKLFESLGLEREIERAKEKKIRAGKGKMRGRKYKKKVGPLIVVSDTTKVKKGAKNLNIDVINYKDISVKSLFPGLMPRLVIFSKKAIELMEHGS